MSTIDVFYKTCIYLCFLFASLCSCLVHGAVIFIAYCLNSFTHAQASSVATLRKFLTNFNIYFSSYLYFMDYF